MGGKRGGRKDDRGGSMLRKGRRPPKRRPKETAAKEKRKKRESENGLNEGKDLGGQRLVNAEKRKASAQPPIEGESFEKNKKKGDQRKSHKTSPLMQRR